MVISHLVEIEHNISISFSKPFSTEKAYVTRLENSVRHPGRVFKFLRLVG